VSKKPRPATRVEVRKHYLKGGYEVRVHHLSGAVFFRRPRDAVPGDPSAGWQDGRYVSDYCVVDDKVVLK
jgi:hypothetical protein